MGPVTSTPRVQDFLFEHGASPIVWALKSEVARLNAELHRVKAKEGHRRWAAYQDVADLKPMDSPVRSEFITLGETGYGEVRRDPQSGGLHMLVRVRETKTTRGIGFQHMLARDVQMGRDQPFLIMHALIQRATQELGRMWLAPDVEKHTL